MAYSSKIASSDKNDYMQVEWNDIEMMKKKKKTHIHIHTYKNTILLILIKIK